MNLRWHTDYTLCNNPRCKSRRDCWRFTSLRRLGQDQEKDIELPLRISVASFGPKDGSEASKHNCGHFMLDEYKEEAK